MSTILQSAPYFLMTQRKIPRLDTELLAANGVPVGAPVSSPADPSVAQAGLQSLISWINLPLLPPPSVNSWDWACETSRRADFIANRMTDHWNLRFDPSDPGAPDSLPYIHRQATRYFELNRRYRHVAHGYNLCVCTRDHLGNLLISAERARGWLIQNGVYRDRGLNHSLRCLIRRLLWARYPYGIVAPGGLSAIAKDLGVSTTVISQTMQKYGYIATTGRPRTRPKGGSVHIDYHPVG